MLKLQWEVAVAVRGRTSFPPPDLVPLFRRLPSSVDECLDGISGLDRKVYNVLSFKIHVREMSNLTKWRK